MGDDIDVLLLTSVKEMLEKNEIKPQTKSKSKISNLTKVLQYVKRNYPKDLDELIEEFGYKEHIKGLFKYEESEYSKKFPKEYKRILSYDLKRIDRRTPFETARDICANFIMEDLFIKPFNDNYKDYLNIKLNENENRDIEKVATNLPDFIFESYTTGKSLRFDLKIDWVGRTIIDKKFFFRGNEYKEYGEKYQAVALIWCPTKNKYTFVDFRKKVKGELGFDKSKGNKEGFWADLSGYKFKDIYFNFNDGVYIDNIIRDLEKLSKK